MQSTIFNRPFYNCSTNFAHGLSLNRGNVLVKSELDFIKKNNVLFNLIIYRPNKRTKEFWTKRTLNGEGDCKIQIPTETLCSVQCMPLNVDVKPDEFQWM